MKSILTLILALSLSTTAAVAGVVESYLLGGLSRFSPYESSYPSVNLGIRFSPQGEHFYLNGGISLYGTVQSRVVYNQPYPSERLYAYIITSEMSVGMGYRAQIGKYVLKAGSDVGLVVGNGITLMPQLSATHVGRNGGEVGLLLKATYPTRSKDYYDRYGTALHFWGLGLLIRI